jgi:threonine dehydrogenase-like Zn-dependent dehydrogenase
MKAGFLTGVHTFELREAPKPERTKDEALIKVKACGFCGSDVKGASRALGAPRIPGHEFSGVIESIADQSKGFKSGDEVVINPLTTCGECTHCRQGTDHLCSKRGVIGCQTSGGFAEYVSVPVYCLRKKPAHLPFEVASLGDPLGVALHALELAGDVSGKSVMIFGAGAIGLLLLQVLHKRGVAELAISDIVPSHLDVARRLVPGVLTVNAKDDEKYESLRGRSFDICVELAGGHSPALNHAVKFAKYGGLILLVAQRGPTEIDCPSLVFGEKRLQGVFGHRPKIFDDAIDLLQSGAVDGKSIITDVFPLTQIDKAYQRVLQPDSLKVVVQP